MDAEIPAKLYKYRNTGDFSKAIFVSNKVYFSSPDEFNDPFDCGFGIQCVGKKNQQVIESEAWQVIREQNPQWSLEAQLDAAKQTSAKIHTDRSERVCSISETKLADDTNHIAGVLSLSAQNDNILMWSHYADNHKGICIEFRTDIVHSLFTEAKPVVYDEELPRYDLYEVVTNEELRSSVPWMLTKSPLWEYEKEWRVLDFETRNEPQAFPAECITGVILGCRIPASEREKVEQWVASLSHDVTLYEAKQSDTHFRLSIDRID